MTPNQSHIAGLELALQQWNNGGPAAHFAAQLSGLIKQAKAAPQAEPVGSVYTMEPLVPGGEIVSHARLFHSLPGGTQLYAHQPAPDHVEHVRALVEPSGAIPHALANLIGLVKAEFYVCGRPTKPISMALLRLQSEAPEWFACDQQVKP